MDPVARDDAVRALRRERFARGRAAEQRRGTLRVLLEPDAFPSGQDAIVAEPPADRLEQHPLQVAAVDGELRPFVSGGAPERLPIDELPEAVEEHGLARLHRDARQLA